MESREYKTITGHMHNAAYEAYESYVDNKEKIVINVEIDSDVITFYEYLNEDTCFEETIYYNLSRYTPVTITYHEDIITIKEPVAYVDKFDTSKGFIYEDAKFKYNKIDSIEITGDGLEDLVRDRQISDKLISEIKDIISPVKGSLTKTEDKLVIKLPIQGKTYTMELYEPTCGGYRAFYVGYDYLQPWGDTQDNSDGIVKYEIQEAVDYILKNK